LASGWHQAEGVLPEAQIDVKVPLDPFEIGCSYTICDKVTSTFVKSKVARRDLDAVLRAAGEPERTGAREPECPWRLGEAWTVTRCGCRARQVAARFAPFPSRLGAEAAIALRKV
jgi:hypothetical protein